MTQSSPRKQIAGNAYQGLKESDYAQLLQGKKVMEHNRGLSVQRMADAYRYQNAANLENLAAIKM